jgi:hypothetical protein
MRFAMFLLIDSWLSAAFAPVFAMLRDAPAQSMTRLIAPF